MSLTMFSRLLPIALACMVVHGRDLPRGYRSSRSLGKSYVPPTGRDVSLGFDDETSPLESLPAANILPSGVHPRLQTSQFRGLSTSKGDSNDASSENFMFNERQLRYYQDFLDNEADRISSRQLRDAALRLFGAGDSDDNDDFLEDMQFKLRDHEEKDDGLVQPDWKFCLDPYRGFEMPPSYSTGGGVYVTYVISSNNPEYSVMDRKTGGKVDLTFTWLEARNECRKRCMELVSINSEDENILVRRMMKDANVRSVWTAGRLCDGTFCNATAAMMPLRVNGWVWSNDNKKLSTDAIPKGFKNQPWSRTGEMGTLQRQPDNYFGYPGLAEENCIAVSVNHFVNDGMKWSDVLCSQPMPFICEDSAPLLDMILDGM